MTNRIKSKLCGIDDNIGDDDIILNLLGKYKELVDDKNKMTTQCNMSTIIKGTGDH